MEVDKQLIVLESLLSLRIRSFGEEQLAAGGQGRHDSSFSTDLQLKNSWHFSRPETE
jgi:hypothetical protein